MKQIVIAIDGMSGSGKSTLADHLLKLFPEAVLFHMDDFFLQSQQRTPERLAEIGGNVDYERFASEVLDHIRDPHGLTYHIYDCHTQTLSEELSVPFHPLVIVEGAYSCHPTFGNPYDLRIFCEISPELQKKRILERNGSEALSRFTEEWIPKENAYFQKFRIKENCDFVVTATEAGFPNLQAIIKYLRESTQHSPHHETNKEP